MLPNVHNCSIKCICWRCVNHKRGYCCCSDEHRNNDSLDCPEYSKFQYCPDFKPIQVQSTGLNK